MNLYERSPVITTSRKPPEDRTVTPPVQLSENFFSKLEKCRPCKINNNIGEIGTQTDFSFIDLPVPLNVSTSKQNLNLDHSYGNVPHTSNTLSNICTLQEQLSKDLEDSKLQIVTLQKEIAALNVELENFKRRQFCFFKIKDDPSAVKFYTGFLNASSFEAVLDYFKPKVSQMRYWRGSQHVPLDDSTKSKTGKKRKLSI